MKIECLYTHNLRNDAHFQYHTEFLNLMLSSNPETLKVKQQFDAYKVAYDREDEALKKINKSAITQKISDADKARDAAWYGLVDRNKLALKHFLPEVQEAARELQIVINTYGNVAIKRFQEQTSSISNILQEFEGKYADKVALVGLTRWVSRLRECNESFTAYMRERFGESAAKTGIAMKDARGATNACYRAIIRRLEALIEIEGIENYELFVKTLNVIIAKFSLLTNRRKKAQPKPESGQEAEQEEQST